ncbi:MAG: cell surface protein, partial [Nanoarchaeota archaeon]
NWDIYLYNLATGTEQQITTSTADQAEPAIYGDRIVWQDYRNGNWDIYLYNLATGTEQQLTTNIADQLSPAIMGNRIVWRDDRNSDSSAYGNSDIYLRRLPV